MCGISKFDFEFPHIADVKQKLSVFEQRDQGSFRSPVFKTVTFLQKHLLFALFRKKTVTSRSEQSGPLIVRHDQHLPQHDWLSCPRKRGNSKSNFEIPHIADIKQKFSRYCELCRKRIKVLNMGILPIMDFRKIQFFLKLAVARCLFLLEMVGFRGGFIARQYSGYSDMEIPA